RQLALPGEQRHVLIVPIDANARDVLADDRLRSDLVHPDQDLFVEAVEAVLLALNLGDRRVDRFDIALDLSEPVIEALLPLLLLRAGECREETAVPRVVRRVVEVFRFAVLVVAELRDLADALFGDEFDRVNRDGRVLFIFSGAWK